MRAAFLLLTGCEARQSAAKRQEIPAATHPMALPNTAAPVQSTFAVGRSGQLKVLVASESIRPQRLEVSRIGAAQLRIQPAPSYESIDTIADRFLTIKPSGETLRIFYRTSRQDTVWTELDGLFNRHEHGGSMTYVEIQQANLDGQGRPEVLIHFSSEIRGSGGGTDYASDYLLDITSSPPQLLLQASTGYIDESFGEESDGYERSIKLQGREVLVGPIKTVGRNPEPTLRANLTQLLAGRYRYQNGKVFRFRK